MSRLISIATYALHIRHVIVDDYNVHRMVGSEFQSRVTAGRGQEVNQNFPERFHSFQHILADVDAKNNYA